MAVTEAAGFPMCAASMPTCPGESRGTRLCAAAAPLANCVRCAMCARARTLQLCVCPVRVRLLRTHLIVFRVY